MEENQPYQKDIESIRKLMERSVKFISLSGLSGILSGVYALTGVAVAHFAFNYPFLPGQTVREGNDSDIPRIVILAAVVLVASLATGYWLTARKAKRVGASVWDATSKRLMINLAIPLIAGGILMTVLLAQGYFLLLAPVSLIFYGFALMLASPNVYEEVRSLGYAEIVTGLIAAALPGYGLLFWAIGFGVFHIVYGAVMYSKYDS